MNLNRIKRIATEIVASSDSKRTESLLMKMAQASLNHRCGNPKGRERDWWVNFDGWDLVVRGAYTKAEPMTHDCPGHEAEFEVIAAWLPDSAVDVQELFEDLDRFMVMFVGEALSEEAEAAACEAADREREDRRFP